MASSCCLTVRRSPPTGRCRTNSSAIDDVHVNRSIRVRMSSSDWSEPATPPNRALASTSQTHNTTDNTRLNSHITSANICLNAPIFPSLHRRILHHLHVSHSTTYRLCLLALSNSLYLSQSNFPYSLHPGTQFTKNLRKNPKFSTRVPACEKLKVVGLASPALNAAKCNRSARAGFKGLSYREHFCRICTDAHSLLVAATVICVWCEQHSMAGIPQRVGWMSRNFTVPGEWSS